MSEISKYRCGHCGDHGSACFVCGSGGYSWEPAARTFEDVCMVRAVRAVGSEHALPETTLSITLNARLLVVRTPVAELPLDGLKLDLCLLPGMLVECRVEPADDRISIEWWARKVTAQECLDYYTRLPYDDVRKIVGQSCFERVE